MRGRYFGHSFGYSTAGWVIPIIIIAVLLVVAAGVLWFIIRRRRARARAAGLSGIQREALDNFDTQVMSLIAQQGGEVDQAMVVASLGLPAPLVAEQLLDMEHAGMIERHWSVDRRAYCIRQSVA